MDKRLIIPTAIVLFIGFALVVAIFISQQSNNDTKIVLTSSISSESLPEDETQTFDQNTPQIFLYIDLRGIFGQRVKRTLLVKWYYETEQIASHYFKTKPNRPSIIWIEPSNKEGFQKGNYRVDITSPASLPPFSETIGFQVQ